MESLYLWTTGSLIIVCLTLLGFLVAVWRKETSLRIDNSALKSKNAAAIAEKLKAQSEVSELQKYHEGKESVLKKMYTNKIENLQSSHIEQVANVDVDNMNLQEKIDQMQKKIGDYEPKILFISKYEYDINSRFFVRRHDGKPICARCYLEYQEGELDSQNYTQPRCVRCGSVYKDIG